MWRRVAAATMAVFGLAAGSASAQQPPGPNGDGTDLFITIAARVCDSYTDISANKSRNNIQESLRDLGPNTQYQTGQLVNPTQEQEMQPKCRPLTGFGFSFGPGISPDRVTGHWGSLSVTKTPAFRTDVTTLATIPDRDGQGNIRTGTSIEGATTIELSAAEHVAGNNLVLQGGTPDDPVLDKPYPNTYAFGALRCSDDNLNGDNVEYARFSQGLKHIYCFAYYVVPPPTSGTIIVTKQVASPPNADMTFPFQGNISYSTDHRFQLTVTNGAAASMTFYRAATGATDPPWTVAELVPSGWSLTGLACTASLGSTTQRNPDKPEEVSIRLVAGDTVRCTYTDAQSPLASRLLISKVTTGGVGTFPFTVHDAGGQEVLKTTATTTSPDVAVIAASTPKKLDPGTYTVGESLPDATGGHWVQTAVNCDATRTPTRRRRSAPPPVQLTITADEGQLCVFENRFVPTGSITITKTTLNATGTTSFTVTPVTEPGTQYVKTATTTEPGAPALAHGDSTSQLALGRYVIQEHGTVSDDDGDWVLQAANCGGALRPFEQGRVVVELTVDDPNESCSFVNELVPEPSPPEPPNPTPAPIPPVVIEPGLPTAPPQPDLVVTKRALRSTVRLGATLVYRITVRNAGPGPAQDVVVADAPGRRGQLVSARGIRADCDELVPVRCRVGTLAAGSQVTIRVRLRATDTGPLRNVAVAGSSTDEVRLANNVAVARVRVRRASRVGACPAAARPKAHAAC